MCESYSTLCKKFIFCCQVKRKKMNTEVIKRIMNTLYLFGYSDVSDIYSDKQNWSYSQCLLLKRKKLWLNLERKSEIQAFHPFTMKKILQQLKKKQYYAKNTHSELWKMKHLLKFTLHYDCGSEEKSTSVLFRFCEFSEGRNIQRYLHCAVNEKNPIAPYYSINTVKKK